MLNFQLTYELIYCIVADFSDQGVIFQLFSSSTRNARRRCVKTPEIAQPVNHQISEISQSIGIIWYIGCVVWRLFWYLLVFRTCILKLSKNLQEARQVWARAFGCAVRLKRSRRGTFSMVRFSIDCALRVPLFSGSHTAVSYTHLTLPTTPYV